MAGCRMMFATMCLSGRGLRSNGAVSESAFAANTLFRAPNTGVARWRFFIGTNRNRSSNGNGSRTCSLENPFGRGGKTEGRACLLLSFPIPVDQLWFFKESGRPRPGTRALRNCQNVSQKKKRSGQLTCRVRVSGGHAKSIYFNT